VSLEKGGEDKIEKHSEKSAMIGLRNLLNLSLMMKKRKWTLNKLSTFNLCTYFLMEQKINGVLRQ
jgi:hypothetical protein